MASRRLSITLDARSAGHVDRWAPNDGDRARFMREGVVLAALYHDIREKGGRLIFERADKSLTEVVLPF
jgi:hypothetical protein